MNIVIDTREKRPYLFKQYAVNTEVKTLKIGDYSLRGLESKLAIERKSLADLMNCLTKERGRFLNELTKASNELEKFFVVVETTAKDIIKGKYRSKMNPEAAINSLLAWSVKLGINFVFANDRANAEKITLDLLKHCERFFDGAKKTAPQERDYIIYD